MKATGEVPVARAAPSWGARRGRRAIWWALSAYHGLMVLFLAGPLLIVVVASFTDTAVLTFPPRRLSLRWYATLGEYEQFIEAFWLSLGLALLTAAGAVVAGTMAAFAIVRHQFPGRDGCHALLISPLLLPGVVTGIAMLQFFSMLGLPASFIRLWLAHMVITIPYVVRIVGAVLQGFDRTLEEAALILGANRLQTVLRITLPGIRSGLVAGAIFAFIASFDNVVISVFLTSPTLVPLPIRIYNFIESSAKPVVASISTIQMLVLAALLLVTERLLGFSKHI